MSNLTITTRKELRAITEAKSVNLSIVVINNGEVVVDGFDSALLFRSKLTVENGLELNSNLKRLANVAVTSVVKENTPFTIGRFLIENEVQNTSITDKDLTMIVRICEDVSDMKPIFTTKRASLKDFAPGVDVGDNTLHDFLCGEIK